MIARRRFILGLGAMALTAGDAAAEDFSVWPVFRSEAEQARRSFRGASKTSSFLTKGKKSRYLGAEDVDFQSYEKPGTIIIKTQERALYRILGDGRATRFSVAVGKEGFSWAGVAKVAMKREDPVWTPPAEMIRRKPEYAKWAGGMPGGLPINPLGPRAMYLYDGRKDTGFRIHGTIHPESIGTAASSGCIRMLNEEVINLYDETPIGTKVIVI